MDGVSHSSTRPPNIALPARAVPHSSTFGAPLSSGTEDDMFGIDAARATFQELHCLYAVLSVAEKTAHHVFADGHCRHGARTAAWLERCFRPSA